MRIAVVGSGIAGMGAALALSEDFDVRLFEKSGRFGGHANTVVVEAGGRSIPVDTGFIVYNTRNYPNLCGFFEHIGAPTKHSDMSFGFRCGAARWNGGRRNRHRICPAEQLLRPGFLHGVLEIARFNRRARESLVERSAEGVGLGEWLRRERFSDWLRDCYVLPMGGAIWSTPIERMLEFPAASFLGFFDNHDLLAALADRQVWRTVDGGSREYVDRLIARLGPRAQPRAEVVAIARPGGRPHLRFADGSETTFDQVVLACHGPQARALLTDADAQERSVLAAFRTAPNRAILHSDPALMPRRRKVWSSWNFFSSGPAADRCRPAPVTYWMNRLQGIDPAAPLFVSLNPDREPDPTLVHDRFSYAHPVMDLAAFAGQRAIESIQGRGGVWYAGAWLGYGFHEDGLRARRSAPAPPGRPTCPKRSLARRRRRPREAGRAPRRAALRRPCDAHAPDPAPASVPLSHVLGAAGHRPHPRDARPFPADAPQSFRRARAL